jgi:TPP-dependent pyruvate/acetoin dehydrogenase alpha subunit
MTGLVATSGNDAGESGTEPDHRLPARAGLTSAQLSSMLTDMIMIREIENEVERLYSRGLVRGSTHLYQGQEAVAVGACRALRAGDTMTCTYRGHGAVLALGTAPEKVLGEILGKEMGLCRGLGGSMHLADVERGAMGAFAIVGAHLPIAAGLAWGHQLHGRGEVSLTFFGDGSTNIGGFHEAMNLASVWRLPVVFVCENNLYGEYTPIAVTTPVERLTERAGAYRMHAVQVDGNDVRAVYDTCADAVDRARQGAGPTFVEALTYRQRGHSRSDPAKYRPAEEVERWLARDPIDLFAAALVAEQVIAPEWPGSERQRVIDLVRRMSEEVVAAPEASTIPAPFEGILA